MGENKVPKVLAVYLPQFYENEDNNRWWGKGFTDWESVKMAESCFPGHRAPWIPLDKNYYNLNSYETMSNQAKLAKEYSIDGFCFYHYYFQNGKKELEQPAENLLKWKDIDMPFCFNWASESWIRSWSKVEGNVWAEKYERKDKENGNGVLVMQNYGDEEQWREHFEYLLPFFKDDRYIKIDGKPVFIFYSPNDIPVLSEMVRCWRGLAKESGFPDLYLIGARLDAVSDCLDAAIIYEPRRSIMNLNANGKATVNNGVRCFDYVELWNEIINQKPVYGFKTFFCGISGYDDTPRRGKSGECLINRTSEMFKNGLIRLLKKSTYFENEFVLINAWNEWGEGMYLEPDETDGYAYLNAVREAVEYVKKENDNSFSNDNYVDNNIQEELKRLDYNTRKFKKLFNIIDKWLFLQQDNKVNFRSELEMIGINKVAIYGMSSVGKHLLIQLRRENVEVVFGIDQYVGQFGDDFVIYRPEDKFPAVDAIVVTAYDFEAIKLKIQSHYNGKIISIEELIDGMFRG